MTLHDIIHVAIINWKAILKSTLGAAIVSFFICFLSPRLLIMLRLLYFLHQKLDQISGLGSILSGSGVSDFLTGKICPW